MCLFSALGVANELPHLVQGNNGKLSPIPWAVFMVAGHFNHELLNHELFNHEIFNHELFNHELFNHELFKP